MSDKIEKPVPGADAGTERRSQVAEILARGLRRLRDRYALAAHPTLPRKAKLKPANAKKEGNP